MSVNIESIYRSLGMITIVGSAGKMGSWFAGMFRNAGLSVFEVDKDTSIEQQKEFLAASQTVIVSVPISSTCQIIEQIVPLLPADALLADLTSLKEKPLAAMLHHVGEVLGLHPMCAPSHSGLVNQPIVTCIGRDGEKGRALCELFKSWGAHLVNLEAAKHDQLMAVVQGLNHFHSIAFAHALGSIGVSVEDSMAVASPVYKLRMQLMGRILAQDPSLYVDIEIENPYVPAVLDHFQASLSIFREAIERRSVEDCLAFFNQAAQHFGPYCHVALKESDKVLSGL
jgi:prephenate dehydrogenase